LAYIFDPIRNTFVDDEDTSLGNKLALNDEEFEKLLKIPGVFRASEAMQPPQRPDVQTIEAINRFVTDNPRDKNAEGGMIRQNFGDGTITAVKKLGSVVKKDPRLVKLFNEGNLYHLRLGFDKKVFYGTLEELREIYKNRPKPQGGLARIGLEDKKYSKNYLPKNKFLEFLQNKGIQAETINPKIFAQRYNLKFKENPYFKGDTIVDTSKLKNKKFVDNIIRRQVQSGFGTDDQKLQFRKFDDDSVMKRYFNKLRRTMQKKYSVRKIEELLSANKASGLNLSHMDDLYSQYVTTRNIGYTPANFNTIELDKFDKAFRTIYKKRNNLFKNKTKGWEQKVAKLNKDGITLAKASDGFKQFTVKKPDGKTRVVGVDLSKTVDPDDIFKGKRIKDLSDEDVDLLLENRKKIIEGTSKATWKKLIKGFGKKLPLAGTILGINEVANAVELGVTNPVDLYTAYRTSADVALEGIAMRRSPFYGDKSLAGIGGYTGKDELPEIDPYQAADGGLIPDKKNIELSPLPRINFGNGGATGMSSDEFVKELEYYFTNPDADLPKATTFKETMNPIEILNDMIDPRNYPYYADRLAKTGIRIGEFGLRVLPAVGKLIGDVTTKPSVKIEDKTGTGYIQDYDQMPKSRKIKSTGIFSEFLDNLIGTEMTEGISKATGLDDLIKMEEQKMMDRRTTVGPKVLADTATLGIEFTAPIFPGLKLLKAYAKARKLPVDDTTKELLEKEIKNTLDKNGISRRDFMKTAGAGASLVIAKMLGFGDEFTKATKVVRPTIEQTATGGVPPYFFELVKKIKKSGRALEPEFDPRVENNMQLGDYVMRENTSTGEISIQKVKEGGMNVGDEVMEGTISEETITYKPGEFITGADGKPVRTPDEYEEFTTRPDRNDMGKMKDVEPGLDSIEEIIELMPNRLKMSELEAAGYNVEAFPDNIKQLLIDDLQKID